MKTFQYNLLLVIFLLSIVSCNAETKTKENIENTIIAIEEEKPEPNLPQKSQMALYMEDAGLINIHSLDNTIKVNLKYATNDNFTKTILYDDLTEAYLHPLAAEKLVKAQQLLKEIHPDYSLLIYDAARPMSVQKKMYAVVQNTKYKAYVANPTRTGMHNYGMAVDLTICLPDGTPLDMGTPFDFFGKAAGINHEEELRAQGTLNKQQIENRKLLRKVMVQAGFITIRGEWWHFNAVSLTEAKRITRVIE
ncbi:M15 family metallopeptidase [Dysgonomonas sp. OttesenSCG-928-M03]|nr:M15 family metallopeptidase [Dysgonomonas sp. OttesenSCG-928-M03]